MAKDEQVEEQTPTVEETNEAAERLEKANQDSKDLEAMKQERLKEEETEGKAEAAVEPPKPETDQEYVDRVRENGWKDERKE